MTEHNGIRVFNGPRVWIGFAVALAVLIVLGWGLIEGLQSYLDSLDRTAGLGSPDRAITQAGFTMRMLAMVLGGLTIGTALYTARSSQKVLSHRQMPPPGAHVLGNPTVMVGSKAVLWGRIGYVLAAALATTGVVGALMMWRFVDLMMSGINPA